jgi:hypothetical protein
MLFEQARLTRVERGEQIADRRIRRTCILERCRSRGRLQLFHQTCLAAAGVAGDERQRAACPRLCSARSKTREFFRTADEGRPAGTHYAWFSAN